MSSFSWPGSSSVSLYSTLSAFPLTASDGALALALDTDNLYAYNVGMAAWLDIASPAASPTAITGLSGGVSATGPGVVVATVNSVGGSSAANVNAATVLANASTSASTVSTIVKRDSSGVTHLKGLDLDGSTSGFITLLAADTTVSYSVKWPAAQGGASEVLTNDGSGNLSWNAAGASGANVDLSNLSSPTAINQDLTFSTSGGEAFVKTPDVSGSPSRQIAFKSGDSDQGTGQVNIISGDSSGDVSGNLVLKTGSNGSLSSSSGSTNIGTGNSSPNVDTGNVNVTTGSTGGSGVKGQLIVDAARTDKAHTLTVSADFIVDASFCSMVFLSGGGGGSLNTDATTPIAASTQDGQRLTVVNNRATVIFKAGGNVSLPGGIDYSLTNGSVISFVGNSGGSWFTESASSN